ALAETSAFTAFCNTVDRSDPEHEQSPPRRIIDRSIQRFIDAYGRGPFLRPLTLPLLYTTTNVVERSSNNYGTNQRPTPVKARTRRRIKIRKNIPSTKGENS